MVLIDCIFIDNYFFWQISNTKLFNLYHTAKSHPLYNNLNYWIVTVTTCHKFIESTTPQLVSSFAKWCILNFIQGKPLTRLIFYVGNSWHKHANKIIHHHYYVFWLASVKWRMMIHPSRTQLWTHSCGHITKRLFPFGGLI